MFTEVAGHHHHFTSHAGHPAFPTRAVPFILHHVQRHRWLFGGLLCLMIGAASCAIAVQYGMRLLVDAMAVPGADTDRVWWPLVLFVVLIGLESVFWRLGGLLTSHSVIATSIDIRLDLFEHLSGHRLRFFADQLAGALGGRITAAAQSIGTLLKVAAWSILPPCVDFLGALILFLTVDWRMAVVLLVLVAGLVTAMWHYGARGWPLHRSWAEQANLASGELVDAVTNIWSVKAFSARWRERERLASTLAVEARKQAQSWFHVDKTRALHDLGLWAIASGTLAWCIHLWVIGTVTPGQVVMVSALTFRVLHSSRELALAMVSMSQEVAVVDEALAAIATPHGVPDSPDAKPLVSRGSAIEFDDICFAYAAGRVVFDGLSLSIRPGEKVGLVGASGAGKSTLVSLLLRLEDVQRGQIRVDGQPLPGLTQDSLRAAIAVVPQEVSLFHRSILENIRYGRPSASDNEVIAAAQAAYADDFVRCLPAGYETMIGERGAKLSGGQRQRLGIARAILKNAPILILDEATSALDSTSETAIQRSLRTLMQGRTVLAIAHRVSTLAALDRIIVLDNGRIVEDGSPGELLRIGGAFHHLWRLQAEGFVQEQERPAAA
jgi:ATP-binding cassette, subfamily B, bacterial